MATSDQRTCVLCEKPIEPGENVVMIPQDQPAHQKCYHKALLADPSDR